MQYKGKEMKLVDKTIALFSSLNSEASQSKFSWIVESRSFDESLAVKRLEILLNSIKKKLVRDEIEAESWKINERYNIPHLVIVQAKIRSPSDTRLRYLVQVLIDINAQAIKLWTAGDQNRDLIQVEALSLMKGNLKNCIAPQRNQTFLVSSLIQT